MTHLQLNVITALLLVLALGAAVRADSYTVVVSDKTRAEAGWSAVVDALVDKHDADVVTYDKSPMQTRAALRANHPRYVCFVATPAEAGRDFVAEVHRLTRRFDDDPYTDCFWGILTGYDAANALAIARHDQPLTIRKVAAGTEIAMDMVDQGIWYCELEKHRMVVKQPGEAPVQQRGPADTTHALADTLSEYEADLFITSGHATERDWQIGYAYENGYFKSKAGQLYGQTADKQRFEIRSTNPKVYLPIGNCLMGHVDSTDAMALAWMHTANVKQMIGYTVPTWYGYMGWGMLDYFVEQPGRYTMAEAFVANQQALLHRLYRTAPNAASLTPAPGKTARLPIENPEAAQRLQIQPRDLAGLLHDRDVVAFYGDPAWPARMADRPTAYDQKLTVDGETYTLTITPNRGADSFKPINTNGAQRGHRPIIAFLPHRVTNIQLTGGEDLRPLITDDFVLIPNPRQCDPQRDYRIIFTADRVGEE